MIWFIQDEESSSDIENISAETGHNLPHDTASSKASMNVP